MSNTNTIYKSVRIPEILIEQIDEIGPRFGYRSRSEFVIDAIRRRLEIIKGRMKDKEV